MKYFSMFSGIGGFELGIKKATNNTWECVGFSEINKYAKETYKSHFPQHTNYGDCTAIQPENLPDFDFLCGGFPCQAFSIAGKRRGFEDTRGTLFFEIARILKVKRPKTILLENVKGLLNHNKGKTFSVIIQTLEQLGYSIEWMVLNSKDYGVPQNRERVFIIGHLGEECGQKIFPLRKFNEYYNGEIQIKDISIWEQNEKHEPIKQEGNKNNYSIYRTMYNINKRISYAIDANYYKGTNLKNYLEKKRRQLVFIKKENKLKEITQKVSDAQRIYDSKGIAKTLKGLGGDIGVKTGLYTIPVLTPDRLNKKQNGRRFKEDGEPSFTITAQDRHGVYDGYRVRRLTPIECERLQDFPDKWTLGSDTQRYKQCGNAVTVNVIETIINEIKEEK